MRIRYGNRCPPFGMTSADLPLRIWADTLRVANGPGACSKWNARLLGSTEVLPFCKNQYRHGHSGQSTLRQVAHCEEVLLVRRHTRDALSA
jgi:hypothetical protein